MELKKLISPKPSLGQPARVEAMPYYKKMHIFYFSGTGNARKIAHWLSECASQQKVDCQLFDMAKTDPQTIQLLKSNPSASSNATHNIHGPEHNQTLLVFISPIHGFNYPKVTLDFIAHLPKGNNRVVLMAARGGMKMGNKLTPGASGAAFMYSGRVLRGKGYTIMGQIPFNMPANCLILYPAQKPDAVELMLNENKKQVEQHCQKILNGEPDFPAQTEVIKNTLLALPALAYYLTGRFSFAKSFYASSACTNCGICQKICPFQAIILQDNRPFWTLKCQSCMKCINNCPVEPRGAIETAQPLLLFTALVTAVASYAINCGLLKILPHILPSWLTAIILFIVLFSPVQVVLYRLQHKMLKNPSLSSLISKLSPSHYKFWGRYNPKE